MEPKDQLYAAIGKAFNVPVDSITPETHFYDDLHSRSVNMYVIAAAIEEITGKTTTYAMIHSYKTVGEMTEFMEGRLS